MLYNESLIDYVEWKSWNVLFAACVRFAQYSQV